MYEQNGRHFTPRMHDNPFFTKAALSFIPGSTGEAAFMVAAGAVTKPVLFVGSFVAKPLMFAGQKAFNSSAKFLGLSSAKEAKVAYNAANAQGNSVFNAFKIEKLTQNT